MRILGVDTGTVRIGLAVSDPLGIFAQPLGAVQVKAPASAADEVAKIAKERGVERIVIGLPRNMDGSLGPKAEEARAFGALLVEKTGLPVDEWDERLSTMAAERALRQSDMSRDKRKKRVDMVAAQIILQAYLDAQRRKSAP
jgi:putative Holliday junction resolvase